MGGSWACAGTGLVEAPIKKGVTVHKVTDYARDMMTKSKIIFFTITILFLAASCAAILSDVEEEKMEFMRGCYTLMRLNKLPHDKATKFCEDRWLDIDSEAVSVILTGFPAPA